MYIQYIKKNNIIYGMNGFFKFRNEILLGFPIHYGISFCLKVKWKNTHHVV